MNSFGLYWHHDHSLPSFLKREIMTASDPQLRNYFDHADDFDLSFKVFHELMQKRVSEILLVSSPYDAFIMEEGGRLAERIIHEYRGLNLTRPPRINWVSSIQEAFQSMSKKLFDLVITMPRREDPDPYVLSREIQSRFPDLPAIVLAHDAGILTTCLSIEESPPPCRLYVWNGNIDLLLAIIKNTEDQMNVAHDTDLAKVRVIVLVEDSPKYLSSILPLLYRVIVVQTQAVMADSVNEEHRILRMRARPRVLVAGSYEEAETLFQRYQPYVLSVFSDVRFPRAGKPDERAGFRLSEMISKAVPSLPLLLMSSDETNREKASGIPAVFLNKNSSSLHDEIQQFFQEFLGFGDFIFRMPDGREVARASNLKTMEAVLAQIPEASVFYHAERDHFSTWLMARSEIRLASQLQPVKTSDFSNPDEIRAYLIDCIRKKRKGRHRGIIADFTPESFDSDVDFIKIGNGSLGGKGRGLAFLAHIFNQDGDFQKNFPEITVGIPQTLVVTTEAFDAFLADNELKGLWKKNWSDERIVAKFLASRLPIWLLHYLEAYLSKVHYPLAIRSSSLLEDSQFQPYAGLYRTYMIPNNHPEPAVRLEQLMRAVKLVYASTYLEAPRAFARSTSHRMEEEKMAVIIQQAVGHRFGDYFFPPVSGVAQSYNYYSVSHLKPEDGIVHMAMGLGKIVVEGGKVLRFSPAHPQFLPQFSRVDDMLRNAQRHLFALKMTEPIEAFGAGDNDRSTLARLELDEIEGEIVAGEELQQLVSTYLAADHRIRDAFISGAPHLITFAGILKYNTLPLPGMLREMLRMGRVGMGSPVEIEFAVDLPSKPAAGEEPSQPFVGLLQIRPMTVYKRGKNVQIEKREIEEALCFSRSAMGNGVIENIRDIVYVKPDAFDPAETRRIVMEIRSFNQILAGEGQRYLLVGPGRWGSADRWLGIPVDWSDISGIGAIIETASDKMKAEPSQGTHFFHNITSLGIAYITVRQNSEDFLDERRFEGLPVETEKTYTKHIRIAGPLQIKIDGKTSCAVVMA